MKNWLIYGNIWVAINAASLTALIELLYLQRINITSLFVFFATVAGYNLIRLIRLKKINSKHKASQKSWGIKNRKNLWLLTIFSLVASLIIALKFSFILWLLCGIAFCITALYTYPFAYGKGLRDFPVIKLFLIAIVWTFTSIALPLIYSEIPITFNEHVLASILGMFVIAITLPFDIRDVLTDKKSMRTLPQLIGLKNTKIVATGLLFAAFWLLVFYHSNLALKTSTALVFLFSAILIIGSSPKRKGMYFSFWIEGMPLLWLLVYVGADLLL